MGKHSSMIAPGCTVNVTIGTAQGLYDAEYLISRGKTRLEEGVLNQRHRLAKMLAGLSVGQVITPGGSLGIFWLRVNHVAPPGRPIIQFVYQRKLPEPPALGGEGDADDVPFLGSGSTLTQQNGRRLQ